MAVTRALTEGDGLQLLEDPVLQLLRIAVRRDVVAYLADLANSSRVDRGAGVVAFNPLLDYPAGSVGARLKSIITGIGEGQPWADVDALLGDLLGRITVDQLEPDVQAAIGLVTADVAVAGSVAARVKGETDARVAALLAEADARSSAIGTAVGNVVTQLRDELAAGDHTVNSRVTTEVATLAGADGALGLRVDNVVARLTPSGDVGQAIATASSYAYTKAQTDSAVASTLATVRSEFAAADHVVDSRITSEVSTLAGADGALGTRIDNITVRLNTGDIAASLASLATYAYTKAQSDSATATTQSTLRSEFNGADDAIKARLNAGGDIYSSLATANSYAYTKAQSDSAMASSQATLRSEFNGADDAIKARLNPGGDIYTSLATANSYAYTKAQSDSAIATSQATLRSEFNGADDAIKARLNPGGDIYTSLATANSYAYTKAQSDSAIATSQATLRSEFNPIGARLNAGGDIYAALATANSYAYTKAQSDSAIASSQATLRSEFNPISARLNAGGDIYAALATANSYAYTKAQTDTAIASSSSGLYSTIVGPAGPISAAVTTEAIARATADGQLGANYTFKVSATRTDGRKVFSSIGLVATGPTDNTGGQSEIILSAAALKFVPAGGDNVNADPATFMEVGVVDGVTTLTVPAARIGDLTVGTSKIAAGAVTAFGSSSGTSSTVPASVVIPAGVVARVLVMGFQTTSGTTASATPGGTSSVSMTGLGSVTIPMVALSASDSEGATTYNNASMPVALSAVVDVTGPTTYTASISGASGVYKTMSLIAYKK